MEIRIIFADESSVFEKSFLEQNYPYFKTLFNSGMKDSRNTQFSLPMKLQTFHDLAISDAKIRSFLDTVGATRDSGMIDELKSAMMFLQVDKRIQDVFGNSNVIMEWLIDGRITCVNTVADMRRQINLVFMDKFLVDVGVTFFVEDLEVHIAKKVPEVDNKFLYVKYRAWDAPLFIFFKNKNMIDDDIEMLIMFERREKHNSFSFKLPELLPENYKNHEIKFDQSRSLYTGYPAQVTMRNINDYGGNFFANLKQSENGKLWKVRIRFWKKRIFVNEEMKASQKNWEEDDLVFLLYEDDNAVQLIAPGEFYRKDEFVTVPHFAIVE